MQSVLEFYLVMDIRLPEPSETPAADSSCREERDLQQN